MSRDTTVIPFRQPEAIDDPLSELAREVRPPHAGPEADYDAWQKRDLSARRYVYVFISS